jgi:hypothetical protein
LPVTNLAAAAALAAAGPGRLRLGPRLPRHLAAAMFGVGGLLAALSLAKLGTAQKRSAAGQPVPSAPAPDEPGTPAEAGDSPAGAGA